MIRPSTLLLVVAIPAMLSGCFLFGGDDDGEEKGAMTSNMADGGVNEASALGNAPPSPWRSIELPEEQGSRSTGGMLPIAALIISVVSLGITVLHWTAHRGRFRAAA